MAKALWFFGLLLGAGITAIPAAGQADVPDGQATVRVEPSHLQGPRALADQTEQGAIRDYLEAWKTMRAALEQNQPGLLNADFVGTEKDKLTETIHEQVAAGLHTRYQDRSHDLQVVFYSPEGLSIELVDTVDYDVQVFDNEHTLSTQQAHARYVVLLTPAEVRWRVRVLQAQ